MKDFIFVVSILMLVVLLLAIVPIAFLWSINGLFGLGIPYEIKSIAAAWILLAVIRLATRVDIEAPRK